MPPSDLIALAGTAPLPAEASAGVAAVLIGVLVVLLLEQEVLRAARGVSARLRVRVLSIAVVPLLIAFMVVVAVQLATILG